MDEDTDSMAKLREIEILGHLLEKKTVTAAGLADDLNMTLELAARWLAYLHEKGWLSKEVLPPYSGRFFYKLSPAAQNMLQEVRGKDDTWKKVAWFGLGALLAIALTKSIKPKKKQMKQAKKNRKKEKE